ALLSDFRPTKTSRLETQEADTANALLGRLADSRPAERFAMIVQYVQDEVAQVLRLDARPELERGFFDLGMDSLMAVELRHRLQRSLGDAATLTSTAIFDYPTVRKLARHLADQLALLPLQPALAVAPRSNLSEPVAVVGLACRFPGAA